MIPSVIARQIQRGVEDFLLTTFPITNPFFAGALEKLLATPGMLFRGPYLSVKLPFVTEGTVRRAFPDVTPEDFVPYRHQQQAFDRLDTRVGRSTIIATGTGSGKTESFLYPILDHCFRQRARRGIKAILVYPMNALATDQSQRVAKIIWNNPGLRGFVSAGLYLGDREEEPSRVMSERELITDREILKSAPPDILLTNYKMLDYLLIRPSDFGLWRFNQPETLRYLVVDELHTFDGAQGADLACLIRRIKERVKTPPGYLCCVGTSATLGEGSQQDLAAYGQQLFGEPFDENSVIGESLQTPDEFLRGCLVTRFQTPGPADVSAMDPVAYESAEDYLKAQLRLWMGEEPADLATALKQHAFFRNMLTILASRAVALPDLAAQLKKQIPAFGSQEGVFLDRLLGSFLALVAQAKVESPTGPQPLVQIRLQLWLRELRRMVAPVRKDPMLAFADDLKPEELKRNLPVIHCRECGVTGWAGTVRDADTRINPDLQVFYNSYFSDAPQVQFIYPEMRDERDGQLEFPRYICTDCLNLQRMSEPDACANCGGGFDHMLSVYIPPSNRTIKKKDGTEKLLGSHDCWSCGGHNSLTIMGSRAASLTSVIISQLFSSPFNDDKKLLTFSDSVQDASHRAGFFAARTYTFNLRSALQKTVSAAGEPIPFETLTERFIADWKGRLKPEDFLATFLPPDMNWLDDYEFFRLNGVLPQGSNLRNLLERRLNWEIWSEYTFDCRIGRTLEKTGSSTLELKGEVRERAVELLLPQLREKVGHLRALDEDSLNSFLAGFVQNLKNRGGVIEQDVLPYVDSLGDTWLLGKQNGRAIWRPNFSHASRAPVFLTSRSKSRFQTLLRQSASATATWYEAWLEKCFREIDPRIADAAELTYEIVIEGLKQAGLLWERTAPEALVWGLEATAFQVTTKVLQFRCKRCSFAVSVGEGDAEAFKNCDCMRYNCGGHFEQAADTEDYYRRLYQSGDVQRIFSAEHTSLLDRKTRERVEQGFKNSDLPGDPNLLSCTPTLEMGINIGDLSSIALCSVPPKPSNYLQRVGRAGRTNGNSFALTVANARPHDLFFYFEPEEMIQGHVETPGCFLNASAVLERQLTAYLFDRWVESGVSESALPRELRALLDVVDSADRSKGFPANLLAFFQKHRTALEDGFLAMFGDEIKGYTQERIRAFSSGTDLDITGLERSIWSGLEEMAEERKTFRSRIQSLTKKIRDMRSDPARDQQFDEAIEDLVREKDAMNEIVKSMNERKVLNFFTDEGLLPNYAFPEAGVILRSVIYQRDTKAQEDDRKYKTRTFEYARPAAAAISELAPANHFYAEGRKLEIDQVSLQLSHIEWWRFCPDCEFLELEGLSENRTSCPQCGCHLWADEGQRRKMLRMRQVISTQSEQQSRSYDESDDREPEFYQKNMFVVKDDADISEAYFIDREEVPFGFEFFRKVTLREVNFGEKVATGPQFTIAGRPVFDRPFELCGSCGKVRKSGKIEHAVYCRYWRKEEQEKVIEACFLYREFTSEAIRMLLPVASFDVDRNVHSFLAALDLGLRKKFRGDPGHLQATLTDEPVPGSEVRKRYLVLYDSVPGGTGYLKELMRDQQTLLEVFEGAHDVLKNCTCQNDPEKDGCYRCLLAYRGRHHHQNTSRQAAIELLKLILDNRQHLKRTAKLGAIRINRLLESELEGRFIEALRRTEQGEPLRSVTHQVVNGKEGFYLRVHPAKDASAANVEPGNYLIEPQVEIGHAQGVLVPSRADFVIYPERPLAGELPIAIFTDGYEYHADRNGGLRVESDTAQRLALMRSGRFRIWSLTWDDVQEQFKSPVPQFRPEFLAPGPRLGTLLAKLDGPNAANWMKMESLSSLGALLLLLGKGRSWAWSAYAHSYTASWLEKSSGGDSSPRIERRNSYPDNTPLLGVDGNLPAEAVPNFDLSRISVRLQLHDDHAQHDPMRWKKGWREFLRLGNLLQFVDQFEFVSSLGLKNDVYGRLFEETKSAGAVSARLASLLELVTYDLRELCRRIAEGGKALPEAGFELTNEEGEITATAELAWPVARVAVLLDHELDRRRHFSDIGWQVFEATSVIALPYPLLNILPNEVSE